MVAARIGMGCQAKALLVMKLILSWKRDGVFDNEGWKKHKYKSQLKTAKRRKLGAETIKILEANIQIPPLHLALGKEFLTKIL